MEESTIRKNAELSVGVAYRLKSDGATDESLNALADHLEAMWKKGYNPMPMVNAIRLLLDEEA